MDAVTGESQIVYDARGLVEPNAEVPKTSKISGETAEFDAQDLTTRQINLELRWLINEQGVTDVTVKNPGAKHSLGVGLLTRCKITFEGSLGYFGCGIIDGRTTNAARQPLIDDFQADVTHSLVLQTSAGFPTASRSRASFAATTAPPDLECNVDPPPVFIVNPTQCHVLDCLTT